MAKIDDTDLTARKANRAGERLKAWQDRDDDFVSATTLVDKDGEILDPEASVDRLELIIHELRRINTQLTLLTGNEV